MLPTTRTLSPLRRIAKSLILTLCVLGLTAAAVLAAPARQAASDEAIPDGWHYRQASGTADGRGFDLRDLPHTPVGPVSFWTHAENMGGVEILGYPASRAFVGRDGCVYQVLQRVTLQACQGHGIRFANTFQILEEAVQDTFLDSVRQIPRGRADGARSFDEAVAVRLGWLWDDAIRAAFYNPPHGVAPSDPWTPHDAINLYGLPMSIPEDYGPFVSQRFQRIAFQRWKVDHPAGIFAAGSVVPVLGGDLLKETGVLSGEVTTPHAAGASLIAALPSVPSFPPVPGKAPPPLPPPPPPPKPIPTPEPRPVAPPTPVATQAPQATAAPIPPTATPIPPTATPVPPTATPRPLRPLPAGRPFRLEYGFQAHLLDTRFGRRANAIRLTQEAGFTWIKQQVVWSQIEKQPGIYDPQEMSYLDGSVNDSAAAGLKVLLSIVKSPDFYAVTGGHSPADPTKLGDFFRFLASRYKGKVQAFETWNEQNLAGEWGQGRLCGNFPAEFLALQKAAYEGVKAGNPQAVVVFPALTPTGHGDCNAALDDVVYLDRLYRDTGGQIKNYFDVMGTHPSGYNSPPGDGVGRSTAPGSGFRNHPSFFFLRFTELREVMLRHGDDKPMWFTEFGWSVCDPNNRVPHYEYCGDNSEEERARYFEQAFQMLWEQYPYVQVAIVWNLNFRDIVPSTDEKYGFGLVNNDGSTTPAYDVLKAQLK